MALSGATKMIALSDETLVPPALESPLQPENLVREWRWRDQPFLSPTARRYAHHLCAQRTNRAGLLILALDGRFEMIARDHAAVVHREQ